MAETSEGWDGTINEAGMARILATAVQPRVESGGELSIVSGQRRVVLAPLVTHHAFIRHQNTQGQSFELPAPAAGQWHLLIERRVWANNTVVTRTLPGPTTSSDPGTISLPPEYPDAFTDQPGVSADLPLYWIWVRSTDNQVITFPIVRGRPYLAQAGELKQENSGLVPAGYNAQFMNFTLASPVAAGTLMHFWAQVDLYTPAGNYGGRLRIVRLDGSSQIIVGESRWHNHDRGERWLYPTVDFATVAGKDLPAGTQFSVVVTSDGGSSGPVEVWFPRASWYTL